MAPTSFLGQVKLGSLRERSNINEALKRRTSIHSCKDDFKLQRNIQYILPVLDLAICNLSYKRHFPSVLGGGKYTLVKRETIYTNKQSRISNNDK